MDVEASYYDVMCIAGKIVISQESQSFQRHLDDRSVSGLLEDSWKQMPGKIMFGDRLLTGLPPPLLGCLLSHSGSRKERDKLARGKGVIWLL